MMMTFKRKERKRYFERHALRFFMSKHKQEENKGETKTTI
jgi:hypothetical protein